ncbi:MAG: DUF6261 family protein [Alloprevotella sp.]
MSKVKVIAAFRLTNGAYLGYHRHIHSALTEAGAEALGLSELIGPYAAAIGEMENVINRPRAFQESRLIAQLDKSRDSYWKAIYRCLAHLSKMPANDSLYPYALTAFTALKQFKGAQEHEYSRESEELDAVNRIAAEPKVKEALTRLGLVTLFNKLALINSELRALHVKRSNLLGQILAINDGRTTAEVRANLKILALKIAARLDAMSELIEDEPRHELIEKTISELNAITQQYSRIQATKNSQERKASPEENPTDTSPACPE